MAESAFTGYTSRGEYVDTVQITAEDGMTAVISTLGARLLDLRLVCGTSVVLRHASLPEIGNDAAFINAVVGRVANRIAHGRITRHAQMSGVRLARHDGEEHTLHGGTLSWDRRLFSVTEQTPQHVALHMWSPHGDNGFPSDVHVVVRYSFTAASQLVVRLATTNVGSISTITNMTTHPYFDLTGNAGTVENSALDYTLHAPTSDKYLVTDKANIPTGEAASVQETRFDFRTPRKLHDSSSGGGDEPFAGYDNYWVSNYDAALNGPMVPLLTLTAAASPGARTVRMAVDSNQCGFQLYTSNGFDGTGAYAFAKFGSVAIEPSGFIDAPNHDAFPSIELKPSETRVQVIRYTFSTVPPAVV